MNPNVTVLSSKEITREELKDVLLKAGGVYHPDPGGGNFGVIMQGERCIWILVDQDYWQKSAASYLNVLKQDQLDVLEERSEQNSEGSRGPTSR